MKWIVKCVCLLSLFVHVSQAQDGIPDSSFSADGKATIAVGSSSDYAGSVIIQPDGKIIVAGQSYVVNRFNFSVIRLNADGSLDATFDTDGKVITALDSSSAAAVTAVLQPDGKIILGGGAQTPSGNKSYFALVRYCSNGRLDSTFGSGGIVETSIRSTVGYDECRSIALQSDGKIVAAGYADTLIGSTQCYHIALVRYLADGSLDASFDGDGKLTTSIGGTNDYGMSVAIQSNGKIVVAGSAKLANKDFAVLRYNPDGSLDNAFGSGGIVTTAIGSGDDDGKAVAIQQSDGKIVVAGTAAMATSDIAVARYDTTGVLDTSFSLDGKVTTDIAGGSDAGQGIVIQLDGKIVVVGSALKTVNPWTYDFATVRYTTAGSLDGTFGTGGKVVTSFAGGSYDAQAISAAVEADGSVIAAGFGNGNVDYALARYRLALPLPVELTSFTAHASKGRMALNWSTATETNNYGFEIERKSADAWKMIGFVTGCGSTNMPHAYRFEDSAPLPGTDAYRLKQIDRDGNYEYSKEIDVAADAPTVFALEQNYPNPFNPTTTIVFTVPSAGHATLKIFNMIGQETATLFNGEAAAGIYHQVRFNASGLASGLYFSRLEYEGTVQLKRMLLVK